MRHLLEYFAKLRRKIARLNPAAPESFVVFLRKFLKGTCVMHYFLCDRHTYIVTTLPVKKPFKFKVSSKVKSRSKCFLVIVALLLNCNS
jgi:hypothetical protein